MSIQLPIDCIMSWNNNKITDHGRSELSVSTEKMKNEGRMVNGTLRRYTVAEKRTWQASWDNLFSKNTYIVDGFWSGELMRDFYNNTPGEFTLTLTMGDGSSESVLVMFSDFSYSVLKRGPEFDLWTLSCEMVEV